MLSKSRSWLLAAAVLLAFSATNHAADVPEATAATETAAGDIELTESYAQIAQDAGLKDAELAAFKAVVNDGNKKLEAWKEGENGKKLVDLRKQLSLAGKAKDEAKAAELRAEIKPLNAEAAALRVANRGAALATLSPAQQTEVVRAGLNRRVTKAVDAAVLTPEQTAAIKALTDPKADEYLKVYPLDKDPGMTHLIGLQSSLVKTVKADILTAEQQAVLKAKTAATKPVEKGT